MPFGGRRGYKARLKSRGFTVSVFMHHARVFPQPDRRALRIDFGKTNVFCDFIQDRRVVGRIIRVVCREIEANRILKD